MRIQPNPGSHPPTPTLALTLPWLYSSPLSVARRFICTYLSTTMKSTITTHASTSVPMITPYSNPSSRELGSSLLVGGASGMLEKAEPCHAPWLSRSSRGYARDGSRFVSVRISEETGLNPSPRSTSSPTSSAVSPEGRVHVSRTELEDSLSA